MKPCFLLLAMTLVGCSLLTSYDESKLTEDTFARCRDRTDNDGNGLADCDDPSCAAFDICRELTPDSCGDGKDNDGDSLTDCADPGCAALPGVCVEQTVQACTDGKDNDGDGRTDCKDPGCLALDVCRELSAADCSDGQDNDRDGLTDCEDFDCYRQPSCCTISVPAFTGDTFTYNGPCKIQPCTKGEPTCCQSGYQLCNAFDPSRWVVWGLPRPIQDNGAFVTNEPCGCESSGIVSIEDVPLSQGTTISFRLSVDDNDSLVCGGLTVSETFADDNVQCAGTSQPELLLGICLRSSEDGDPRLVAMVDGVAQSQAAAPGGGPVTGTIAIKEDGVAISAGSLQLQTPSPGSALASALVMVHGSGTGGQLDSLTISASRDSSGRCRAPGSWYRHLARGEPVVRRDGDLLQASEPTVVFQPELKSYIMLFSGKSKGDAWDGIYAATSADGLTWAVSATPVFPSSPTDTAFGRSQGSPSLLYRNGQYHVWYTREDESGGFVQRAIAHATSADAKLWTPGTGPVGQIYVLEPGNALEWDSLDVRSPSVVAGPDGNLLMWYTGTRAEAEALPGIGVASSKDGSTWSRLQKGPVLAPEPGTADLACADPAVVYDAASKTYLMWYTYRAFGQQPSIRYAVSPNGLAWSRWPTTVFAPGALGTFDERGTVGPTLLLEAPVIKLWYTGLGNSGVPQIGYAENRGQR